MIGSTRSGICREDEVPAVANGHDSRPLARHENTCLGNSKLATLELDLTLLWETAPSGLLEQDVHRLRDSERPFE
jgi:hypothetical protein